MILTSHTKKDNEITSKIYSHFNAKLFINNKKTPEDSTSLNFHVELCTRSETILVQLNCNYANQYTVF